MQDEINQKDIGCVESSNGKLALIHPVAFDVPKDVVDGYVDVEGQFIPPNKPFTPAAFLSKRDDQSNTRADVKEDGELVTPATFDRAYLASLSGGQVPTNMCVEDGANSKDIWQQSVAPCDEALHGCISMPAVEARENTTQVPSQNRQTEVPSAPETPEQRAKEQPVQFIPVEQLEVATAEIEVVVGIGCLYAKDSTTGKNVPLSNFNVTVLRLRKILGKYGEVDALADLLVFCGEHNVQERLSIHLADLDNVVATIKRKILFCYVSQDVPKAGNRIVDHIRREMTRLITVWEYADTGWFRVGDRHVYLHDGLNGQLGEQIIVNTGRTIERGPYTPAESCATAFELLSLSSDLTKILPLFLFAHTSLLYSLFKEAGYTPTFLLFVNGATGSLKTAVSLLLFTFFNGSKTEIPATFKDTPTAIEVKMSRASDCVLLVDDFHPATTSREKIELDAILERVIRFFGDGVGKSRGTNTLDLAQNLAPQGMCAITGEDSSGSQSSLLRCLMIEVFKNTFQSHLLARFQQNPLMWTSHIADFVNYVGSRYEGLVQYIKTNFSNARDRAAERLKERRSAQTVATLTLTAQIVLDYVSMLIPTIPLETIFPQWEQAIVQAVNQSESAAVTLNPATMFLVALQYQSQNRRLLLAKDMGEYQNASQLFTGYISRDGCWHLDPAKAYHLVREYWSKQQGFPFTPLVIYKSLDSLGVIVTQLESRGPGQGQKLYYLFKTSLEGRPRFLSIDPTRMANILENIDN